MGPAGSGVRTLDVEVFEDGIHKHDKGDVGSKRTVLRLVGQ